MALREAIHLYNDLLTDELAAHSQDQLDTHLERKGLFFAERPLATVLRPRFLTWDQYRFLTTRTRPVMRAMDKIYRKALADKGFRAQFGLLDWEEDLLRYDPGFRDPAPTSRLDAFFVPDTGELRFIEYNAETPAGTAYNDVLSEVMYNMPVMRRFLRHYAIWSIPARHGVLNALLDAHLEWAGRRVAPRLAILDWREVPTYSEFVLYEEYFKSQGVDCVIADPREVEYKDGRLMAGDFHITLIYKRMLVSELIEGCGMDSPIVRAVKDRAVCMVNPFRSKILYKKASLAVLSDERNVSMFARDEIEAIEAHIPWTRRVEDRQTLFQGQVIDLLPYINDHREQFVLKANDDYGGKGVYLGWQTSPEKWAEEIERALNETFVVQQRVPLYTEAFPVFANDKVGMLDLLLDTNPFVFNTDYVDGVLTRLSAEDLLNVTAGAGSTVPTFLVEKR